MIVNNKVNFYFIFLIFWVCNFLLIDLFFLIDLFKFMWWMWFVLIFFLIVCDICILLSWRLFPYFDLIENMLTSFSLILLCLMFILWTNFILPNRYFSTSVLPCMKFSIESSFWVLEKLGKRNQPSLFILSLLYQTIRP